MRGDNMDIRKIVEWVVKGMYITLVSYILLVYKDNFKFYRLSGKIS